MSTNSVPSGPTKVVATNVAADWLREHDRAVAAAAWDEGVKAATDDGHDGLDFAERYVLPHNPYSQNALIVPPPDQD